MIRRATFLTILLFCQSLFSKGNEEFRATWIVDAQWIKSINNVAANKSLTGTILDHHKNANMNAVLWQVRRFGNVYFDSSYEPWGSATNFRNPGYDPFEYAVQQAHSRGFEIHAYFNVFENRRTYNGSPAQKHPEWICRDRDGNLMPAQIAWLSPGLIEVQNYLSQVAMELVRNYDIDGLHLDFIRWNNETNSAQSLSFAKVSMEQALPDGIINEDQLNELITNASNRYLYDIVHPFNAGVPQGFSFWEDWWRGCVTEFVRVLHDSIQNVKPWVRLSVAALGKYNWSGWQGYGSVYQDAALWFNEGYIDQLTPMHYHWFDYNSFYNMLAGPDGNNTSNTCWGKYIQKGIAEGRLFSCGPSATDLDPYYPKWKNPLPMVNAARAVPWVDGQQFFSYGDWRDWDYWEKATTEFYQTKAKIRVTKLIVSTPPNAPTIELTKIDSLNYQINVTPPTSIVANHRYAVYRSSDDCIDVSSDEIVDIHFGNSSYSYRDRFPGTQDYNSTYFYAATMLDRYWNESEISNVFETDPIPSFAPTVILTSPAKGDTVLTNISITIDFSKPMDTMTFEKAITISPEMNIKEIAWSQNHKSLILSMDGDLEYFTFYTLIIAPTVTDINGKQLDGNGDGIGGDTFELYFRTRAADLVGPVIFASYPDYGSQTTDFPIDDVITFVFDEPVDHSTVNDSSVKLHQGENEIAIHYVLTDIDEKSVLSIGATSNLDTDTEYSIILTNLISDISGNTMDSDIVVSFRTSPISYAEEILIDKFFSTSNWEYPGYSGSTVGIVVPNTVFEMSTEAYLPLSHPRQRVAAVLRYEWDESATSFLIREYCSGNQPRSIVFDTTYMLQCFVFGDGSFNKFRFCIDEKHGASWSDHEVSRWITIDWYGWRLLEWKLSDPNSVGVWIGNRILDGSSYRVDSFQLTHTNTGTTGGRLYFDNLRLVKKSNQPVGITDNSLQNTYSFRLLQNYPNPFNPTTIIPFDLPNREKVMLEIYDILGRTVAVLINQTLEPGHYSVQFDGTHLASGIYFYRLQFDGQVRSRQMSLLK